MVMNNVMGRTVILDRSQNIKYKMFSLDFLFRASILHGVVRGNRSRAWHAHELRRQRLELRKVVIVRVYRVTETVSSYRKRVQKICVSSP